MHKVEFKSKVKKLSGAQPKASFQNRPATSGPAPEPRRSATAGRKQKPGDKPPSSRQSRRDSKGRSVKSFGQTAVRFPIVGIGASAGGLEACTHLLHHLPLDTGMGFVLVQHLDPAHASALTQLLARATSMPVREVSNNTPVQPNHLYVIPPNATMSIAHGI